MSDFSPSRLVGLDIVRGGAILSVLFAHARFLVDTPNDYLFLAITGKFGVELFFVLSGFLIGAILLRACERELSFSSLNRFWTRRWLRTLPAYFGVLLFVWAVYGEVDYLYFLFLQDLVVGDWDILPVSWTLVIEEWFYLLFPPTCFVLLYLFPRYGFLIAVIALLMFSAVMGSGDYNACAVDEQPLACFEDEIRKFTFRFTSLGIGALLAYLHKQRDLRVLLKPHLTQLKIVTAALSLFVLVFCGDVIINFPGVVPVPVAFAAFYPMMGVASAFIVALFFVWEPKPPRAVAVFFTYTSVTSYSCYLWHFMLVEEGMVWRQGWNEFLFAGLYIIASLLVGGVSYKILEEPFMRLRDSLNTSAAGKEKTE